MMMTTATMMRTSITTMMMTTATMMRTSIMTMMMTTATMTKTGMMMRREKGAPALKWNRPVTILSQPWMIRCPA